MRYRFTITPPQRPRLFLVGVGMFAAAIATAAVVVACSDRGSRSSEARAAELPGVTPSTAVPAAGEPVISGPVSYDRADSAFRDKNYTAAISLFTAYTESKPENPWGHYMLGLSAWKTGDRETAEHEFTKAIELDSTHLKARLNLARVLIETGRHAEAQQQVQAVLALDSTNTAAYRLLGRVHDALGETESAIGAYQRAIALDDHDVWAMNNLAMVFVEQGKYEEALKPLARVVELDPTTATFRNNLGIALERSGRFGAAADAFKAALAIDSGYAKASVSLARVIVLKEDPSLAPVDLPALAQSFVAEIESWRK
jgi:Flp pilus assembly protein TadD